MQFVNLLTIYSLKTGSDCDRKWWSPPHGGICLNRLPIIISSTTVTDLHMIQCRPIYMEQQSKQLRIHYFPKSRTPQPTQWLADSTIDCTHVACTQPIISKGPNILINYFGIFFAMIHLPYSPIRWQGFHSLRLTSKMAFTVCLSQRLWLRMVSQPWFGNILLGTLPP